MTFHQTTDIIVGAYAMLVGFYAILSRIYDIPTDNSLLFIQSLIILIYVFENFTTGT